MADNQFIARKGLISLDDSQITGSLSITDSVTASFFTGSFSGDGTNIYNIPASGVTGLNLNKIISGSVSASISPNNGFRVNTDVYIDGTLTANEIHIDYVTSSVLYQSGSTKFGDTLDDLHEFTGSVTITGSITLNGQAIGTGKLDETTFNGYTSSISSSIGGLSSSIATTTSGLTSTITTLSSSLSGSIDSLSSSVASINNTQNGRLDSLETASGSIRTNFNTFTSSYTTGSFTGSFIGDGSQLTGIDGFPFTGSAKITGSLAVTGSLTVDGNVNATSFTGSIQGTATTASYVNLTNVDGFTAYSSSISSSINSVLDATTPVTATIDNTDSPYTITNETIVVVDSTYGNVSINLPDLNTIVGTPNQRSILIYKNDYSQNVIFVEPSGSQLVNGTTQDVIVSIQIAIAYNPTSEGYVTENTSYQSLAELELFFVPRTETGSLSVSTASYVEYTNVANKPSLVSGSSQISFNGITDKPTLVSGSSQITYSGLTGVPSGIVSGSEQITYSGLTGTPSSIVSSSAQVLNYGIFATTGSNGFNGNQSITGSLTVTGQVVAQTLNVQQVTSSIVFSSGSNIFGNTVGNTHQFTGSVSVTGSLTVNGTSTVVGSGTTNFLPKFTGTSTIGNSIISESGSLVSVIANSASLRVTETSGADLRMVAGGSSGFFGTYSNHSLQFLTNSGTKATLDPSGNLGLGVTPSAFQNTFGSTAFQLYGSYIYGYRDTNLIIGNNAYYDGTWKYYTSGIAATKYNMGNGAYDWAIAPSGTAGNAITFTQAMTLNASGNLSVGNTNDTYKLDVSGSGRFNGIGSNGYLYVSGNAGAGGSTNPAYLQGMNFSWNKSNGGGESLITYTGAGGGSNVRFGIGYWNNTTYAEQFTIASTGAATFSSSVSVNGLATSANYKLGVTSSAFISGPSSKGVFITDQPTYASIVGINSAIAAYNSLELRASGVNGQLFIHTNGNVGIGTTAPSFKLDVYSGASGVVLNLQGVDAYNAETAILMTSGRAKISGILESSGGTPGSILAFSTMPNGGSITERMRITSGGNVQIGNDSNPYLEIANGGSTDVLSGIRWVIGSGRVNYGGMEMAASSADNGYITFKTRNSGSTTERMRITSGGEILKVQTTAVGPDGSLPDLNSTEIGNGYLILNRDDTATVKQIRFGKNGSEVGSISTTGSATSYVTSSDYRLKEDLQEIKGLEKVQAIKVYDYKWKSDESRMDGVLAHELSEVLPYAVTGEKDELNEDGTEKMQGVDYSKIVPILIKAIQELKTEIDSLKNQIK